MKQAIPKTISKNKKNFKKKPKSNYKPYHGGKPFKQRKFNKKNQKYGTSKLELDFANDFLIKNNLVFIYQYEAKDIKRFFDFAITCCTDTVYEMEEKDGLKCVKQEGQFFPLDLLIEVDGSYYHNDPRVVKENKVTPMHKHNMFIDNLKTQWAALHGVPLLRIWEYDIRNNPNKVKKELEKYVDLTSKKRKILESRKKPH